MCNRFLVFFFFFKQKTAYELRISYWSADVCSSDLKSNLLSALSMLVDFLASGSAPRDWSPFLAGGRLIPLKKGETGVRPIAVGEVVRRLASKCLAARRSEERRVGTGCDSTGSSRWAPETYKKKKKTQKQNIC